MKRILAYIVLASLMLGSIASMFGMKKSLKSLEDGEWQRVRQQVGFVPLKPADQQVTLEQAIEGNLQGEKKIAQEGIGSLAEIEQQAHHLQTQQEAKKLLNGILQAVILRKLEGELIADELIPRLKIHIKNLKKQQGDAQKIKLLNSFVTKLVAKFADDASEKETDTDSESDGPAKIMRLNIKRMEELKKEHEQNPGRAWPLWAQQNNDLPAQHIVLPRVIFNHSMQVVDPSGSKFACVSPDKRYALIPLRGKVYISAISKCKIVAVLDVPRAGQALSSVNFAHDGTAIITRSWLQEDNNQLIRSWDVNFLYDKKFVEQVDSTPHLVTQITASAYGVGAYVVGVLRAMCRARK